MSQQQKQVHLKSVKTRFVVFIFLIMTASAFLTIGIVYITYHLQLLLIEHHVRARSPFLTVMGLYLAVSTFIGTALSLGFSQRFLRPIQQLTEGVKEIRKGNFEVRVDEAQYEGDIKRLVVNFNHMARELAGVELFRTDFINYFSHEFKTPIISIRGFAKQMKRPDLPESTRLEYADIVVRESERLVKLSSNVLTLTKLENQVLVTDQKRFDLAEQIRHCILLLQQEWESKDLALQLDLEELMFYGNEEMLSQVWLNLLSNAIEFSPPGKTLTVTCSQEVNRVKVRIKDQGIGMSDKTIKQVFEKFFQGDSSHSHNGNGLGLAIVKRIIDLCHGSINVKSQLGKGSTFIVYLPFKPKPVKRPPEIFPQKI